MLKTALFVTSTLLSLISAEVIHLKTTNFDNVVDGTRNVLVKFEASWCGPCKAMVPILDQVSNEFPDINGDTVIAAVDVDDEELLANRFQVRALPTVKLFLKGRSQEDHIEYESYRERDVESITNFIKTAIEKNEANLPEDMKYIKRIPLTNLLTKSKSQNALKLGHNAFIKQHKKEMKRNPNGAPRKERTHQNYAEAPKLVKAPKKPKKTAEHRRRNEYAQQQMSGINDVSESEARSIIANAGNKVVIMIVYSHNCPHCAEFLPIAEKYAMKRDDVIFIKLDGQEYYNYRDSFNLEYYPSIIGFKANSSGQKWQLLRGGRTIDNLNIFIKSLQ